MVLHEFLESDYEVGTLAGRVRLFSVERVKDLREQRKGAAGLKLPAVQLARGTCH